MILLNERKAITITSYKQLIKSWMIYDLKLYFKLLIVVSCLIYVKKLEGTMIFPENV